MLVRIKFGSYIPLGGMAWPANGNPK